MTTKTEEKPAAKQVEAKKPANPFADKAKKWKGTYKDFLGDLTGRERSTARKAWRATHGANVEEVK